MKRVLLLLLITILAGCGQQSLPTSGAVIGHYRGEYKGGAVETFDVRKDLTFSQQLIVNGKIAYLSEGRWRIENRNIVFDRVLVAVRQGSDEVVIPKSTTDNMHGLWVTLNGRSRIVFDIDHGYAIDKQ